MTSARTCAGARRRPAARASLVRKASSTGSGCGREGGGQRARRKVRVAGREVRQRLREMAVAACAGRGRGGRAHRRAGSRSAGRASSGEGRVAQQVAVGLGARVRGGPQAVGDRRGPPCGPLVARPPVDGPAQRGRAPPRPARRAVRRRAGAHCRRGPRSGRPGPGAGGCAAAPARPSPRSRAGWRAAAARRRTSAAR